MKEELIDIFNKYILGKYGSISVEGLFLKSPLEVKTCIFKEVYGSYFAYWDTTYLKTKIQKELDLFRYRVSRDLHKCLQDLEGEMLEKSNKLIEEFTTAILELESNHAISFNLKNIEKYDLVRIDNRCILTIYKKNLKLTINTYLTNNEPSINSNN